MVVGGRPSVHEEHERPRGKVGIRILRAPAPPPPARAESPAGRAAAWRRGGGWCVQECEKGKGMVGVAAGALLQVGGVLIE